MVNLVKIFNRSFAELLVEFSGEGGEGFYPKRQWKVKFSGMGGWGEILPTQKTKFKI